MNCPYCGNEVELKAVGSGEAYELDEEGLWSVGNKVMRFCDGEWQEEA